MQYSGSLLVEIMSDKRCNSQLNFVHEESSGSETGICHRIQVTYLITVIKISYIYKIEIELN